MSCFSATSAHPHQTKAVYCLRWKEGKSEVFQAFQEYFYTGHLSDILLTVEGREIRCHKLVLAATCNYFRDLFASQVASSVVAIRGVSFADLEAVVHFIYEGEVRLEEASIRGFLEAAETLGVKGIVEKKSQDSSIEVRKTLIPQSQGREVAGAEGQEAAIQPQSTTSNEATGGRNVVDTGAALEVSTEQPEHTSTTPSAASATTAGDAMDVVGEGASQGLDVVTNNEEITDTDRASDSGMDCSRRKKLSSSNPKGKAERSKPQNASSGADKRKKLLERKNPPEHGKAKYKKYDEKDLAKALRHVLKGMSVREAGRKFGVPPRTIYRKQTSRSNRVSGNDADGSESSTESNDSSEEN